MSNQPEQKATVLLPAINPSAQDLTLQDLYSLGEIFCKSRLFKDTETISQAIVKMIAGREYGLSPFCAMNSLNIIKDKVAMTSALVASRIQEAGGEWQFVKYDSTACILRFFKNGKLLEPDVDFTMDHAKKLNLAGKENYIKQPRTMLYWRALTQGGRMFFPNAFAGGAIAVDEIDDRPPLPITVHEVETEQQPEVLPALDHAPINKKQSSLTAAIKQRPDIETHVIEPDIDWRQIAQESAAVEQELTLEE